MILEPASAWLDLPLSMAVMNAYASDGFKLVGRVKLLNRAGKATPTVTVSLGQLLGNNKKNSTAGPPAAAAGSNNG